MISAALLLQVPDVAVNTALLITGAVAVVAVILVIVMLVIPEEERTRAASSWGRLRTYLITGSTGRVMEFDHEFDGIRELDNRIPPWFTTLFLATVVFAGVYLVNYHVLGAGTVMVDEYKLEVAAADLQRRIVLASEGTIDENALVVLKDPEVLKRAGEVFQKNCISCHGAHGEGIVGPNLTDQFWIHGGSIKNVYTTIKLGVPAKGMISWQLVFTPKQIQELASYVLSLQGTNPLNGKKAEGLLYVPPPDTSQAKL
jgi:cytochrome c oxidase cbb3-type subunit 3